MAFSPAQLLPILTALPAARRHLLAYSGGLDSTVLLHALAALRPHQTRATLAAIHIDHGLSPRAADWSQHCRRVCAALGVPCEVLTVQAGPAPGESPEAAARAARYGALRDAVQAGDLLLLAQHQDDQAETVLLQLLRGAGVPGLAAMGGYQPFGAGHLARPLLGFSRAELAAWAQAEGLQWVDDPSNFDTGFDRNYLRHTILPPLRARWPAVAATLARAAAHQADAAELLAEVGAADLRAAAGRVPGSLDLPVLRALSPSRQRNLLRAWLVRRGLPLPDAGRLERIRTELADARPDAQPLVSWPGAHVRRYRDALFAAAPGPGHDRRRRIAWDLTGPLRLPELGVQLVAESAAGQGLSRERLGSGRLTVRFRQGGEVCRPAGRGHTHSLKKLMQEWGVPPWERDRVPLLYTGEQLAQVVGHAVCEPYRAGDDEAGVRILLRPLTDRAEIETTDEKNDNTPGTALGPFFF